MPISQPIKTNNFGAILTIGGICNGERVANVEPYIFDGATFDLVGACNDLLTSWQTAGRGAWLDAISEDYRLAFISAEGMIDGRIPSRVDFGPSEYPGAIAEPALPTSVAGLVAYYQDPADVAAGSRIRVAKTFFPGLPDSLVTGQTVDAGQGLKYYTYGTAVTEGITSAGTPSQKWWRVLSAPKPRTAGQTVQRIASVEQRLYVATQKRRLVPR